MLQLLAQTEAPDWIKRFFFTDFAIWHFVVRGVIVYVFLLVALRISGKRQVGQLAPFDLILLLVLSNAVQNAMNGGDNSITGGLISATTLIAINWLVSFATFRSKSIAGLIEGRPLLLIHNGKIHNKNLQRVKLTIHELNASLRAAGHACPDSVRFAVLENTGSISVVGMHEPITHASHGAQNNPAIERVTDLKPEINQAL